MTPIEQLIKEHRVIEVVLQSLSTIVEQAITLQRLNYLHAEDALDFFRNYADEGHHGKKEDHLFALMASKHDARADALITDLLREHKTNRSLIKGMDRAFRAAAHGDPNKLMIFARSGRDFVDAMLGHMIKEDRVVFPYALSILTAEDLQALERLFARTAAEDGDQSTEQRYIAMAKNLAFTSNVPEEIDRL